MKNAPYMSKLGKYAFVCQRKGGCKGKLLFLQRGKYQISILWFCWYWIDQKLEEINFWLKIINFDINFCLLKIDNCDKKVFSEMLIGVRGRSTLIQTTRRCNVCFNQFSIWFFHRFPITLFFFCLTEKFWSSRVAGCANISSISFSGCLTLSSMTLSLSGCIIIHYFY